MAAYINTNTASLNSQRNLSASQASLTTSMQRLSSGLRINSAKDDAAGLAISTKMDTQIRGMSQAIRNANDGISMVQTADSALATATDAMQRMRELAIQSKSGTNTDSDRSKLDKEYQALAKEITRLSADTKFNGKSVLATANGPTAIQIGADSTQTVTIGAVDLQTEAGTLHTAATDATHTATVDAAGVSVGASVTAKTHIATSAGAATAVAELDKALEKVTSMRADLGATQNRFSYAISNLQSSVENQSAAKSRIMDADFAAETANMTRGQILQQAGTAMLAQANSLPNGVLSLLRG